MDFELSDEKIQLSGVLEYNRINALHELFKQILEREDPVLIIDIGGIRQIDTAALQLFLALQRDARTKGKEVIWKNIPDHASESLRLTGLSPLFDVAGN